MRILIIEDEEAIARVLSSQLEKRGYAVDMIHDGAVGERRIEMHHDDYDLVILDLLLPGKSGFEICKYWRSLKIQTPVIILTARSSTDDKVLGFECGADDYLAKPFSFKELLARIQAIMRRPRETLPPKLSVGDLVIDMNTRRVARGAREITLSLKEFTLLEYLMRHQNQVLNREQIIAHVWSYDFDSMSNVVDVHMKNLRKKIDAPGEKKLLLTVRGVGYRIVG